jgi:hypothetical protein
MRQMITEDVKKDVVNLIKGYFKKRGESSGKNSSKSKKSDSKDSYSKKSSNRKKGSASNDKDKPAYRSKKLRGGGRAYYNYDDYRFKNTTINKGNSSQIANTIDQDMTNISALARKVFPHHTNNGAQSQLRKILNGERPMTDKVAHKLGSEIATGGVAVN